MGSVEYRTSRLIEKTEYQDLDNELNEEMLDRIISHIDKGGANAFWEQFKQKAEQMRASQGHIRDAQYLLHSNVYYIRDFLEAHNDQQGLDLLDKLESDCF
ncbi:N(2)-fixation sustaining protein CowN [Vibrio sp. FJH11]